MEETFEVNLLRNVQPTDRKLSVSKEFVGPRKKQERGRGGSHGDTGSDTPKRAGLYHRDTSEDAETNEQGSKIDITI